MLYNAELVSAERQSESAIRRHMSPVFWIPFPFWSLQGVRRDPCGTQDVLITLIILLFSVLFIVSVVCIYVNPNLPIHPTPRTDYLLSTSSMTQAYNEEKGLIPQPAALHLASLNKTLCPVKLAQCLST